MVGLIDIAPAVETVTVRGTPVPVFGVSAAGIAYLLRKYPEIRMLLSGKMPETERLFDLGGGVVAAVIAAGTGAPGSEEHEAVAMSLSINDQITLVEAIMRVTMPEGFGPFAARLQAIGDRVGLAASATEPGTKSGKQSKRSSPQGMDTSKHGATPQEN
jgi:hypothetical protein